MITTTDIGDILYKACAPLGLPVYREGNLGMGNTNIERVVIHTRPLTEGTYWCKGFQEVNIFVPDNEYGNANLTRLGDLERMVRLTISSTSSIDGTMFDFRVTQTSIEDEHDFHAHYINAKVLFRAIHTL